MYFYYYRSPTNSNWVSALSAHSPAVKGPEGERRRCTQIVKLPREHHDLTLRELCELYPLDTSDL